MKRDEYQAHVERFALAWEHADSPEQAAEALEMNLHWVRQYASKLRMAGVLLKTYRKGGGPPRKSEPDPDRIPLLDVRAVNQILRKARVDRDAKGAA